MRKVAAVFGGNGPKKIILDLCAGTGAWSEPYMKAGYDVHRIDIETGQDIRLYLAPPGIHGILAAPPCQYLAVSGSRWWKEKGAGALLEALSIVDACLRIIWLAKPNFWALENPVGRLVRYLGKPKMYFDPCDYGDLWTKKTALWGEFNKPKTSPVLALERDRIHRMPPSPERSKRRAITSPGFAQAFFEANQ